MLPTRNSFLASIPETALAVCGTYIKEDAIHVGLFWRSEGEMKIAHFQNGNYIPVQDAQEDYFENYMFNHLEDFPNSLLPTISALTELISENKLNGFIFNRVGVVYNGGKFEYVTGAYNGKTEVEKFINCGVFVIALLNSFDYPLIEWETWPTLSDVNPTFLADWLDAHGIALGDREAFYNMMKEIRGKHIMVAPSAESLPVSFDEADNMANTLIGELVGA